LVGTRSRDSGRSEHYLLPIAKHERPTFLPIPVPAWYRYGMKEDIHVRIETDIADDVRAYAATHGISLAAAVSLLLRRALTEKEQS
jgi:hypothetical protein